MAEQPNALSGLASGLNQGFQLADQRKELRMQQMKMQMEAAKETFNQISGQAEKLGTLLTNSKTPDALIGPLYNQWAAYQKVINPGMALPAVKDITPEDSQIIRAAAAVVQTGKQANVPSNLVQSALQDLFNKAQGMNTSPDFNKKFMDYTASNFGSTPQQITQGGQVKQGTVNAFGQFLPLQDMSAPQPAPVPGMAPQGTPVQAPNVPLMNQQLAETKRTDDLAKEFNNSPDVQGLKKSLDAVKQMQAEVTMNPKGVAGIIAQSLGHAAGDQRVTEYDIPRYAGSPDLASAAVRAANKLGSGDLSKIDQKDYKALLEVIQNAAQARMEEKLNAYVKSVAPKDATPEVLSQLKIRLGQTSLADVEDNPLVAELKKRKLLK